MAIIESYQDTRIRLIRQEHEGIVVALNRGVAESSVDWIARMDADDIAHPARFKIQMMTLERNPSAVLCFSDIDHFGEASEMHGMHHLATTSAMIKLRLCYSCPIIHPTFVFSKAALLAAGGYHLDELHAEDFALFLKLSMKSPGDCAPKDASLRPFRMQKWEHPAKQTLITFMSLGKWSSNSNCPYVLVTCKFFISVIHHRHFYICRQALTVLKKKPCMTSRLTSTFISRSYN